MEYLEVYICNGCKLYSSWSKFQCQFLNLIFVVKFKIVSWVFLLVVNELNLCNITWERRGFVPVYSYQCAKQEDILDDIVPKNSEQFLGLKIFSACINFFYAGLLQEREELEVLHKVVKVFFCLFGRLSALECGFNADASLQLKTVRTCHLKHWEWLIMTICT